MKNFDITNQAVTQVKENNRKYYEQVILFAQNWVKKQFKGFTSENLKEAYYSHGNLKPIEPRVFGAVFRELSKEGLIFKNGFELSKNPKCHSRPQQIWISKEYRLKQQNNRKVDHQTLGLFNN
jgi:hypothetical protein